MRGKATIRGVEFGAALSLNRHVKVDANFSVLRFDLDASSFIPGDVVKPNAPEHKGNVTLALRDVMGLDATINARFTSGFDWSAGTFTGPVPATTTFNASASYAVTPQIRITAVASNLFDQQRYQNFGGAVIGRRVMAGVNARF